MDGSSGNGGDGAEGSTCSLGGLTHRESFSMASVSSIAFIVITKLIEPIRSQLCDCILSFLILEPVINL